MCDTPTFSKDEINAMSASVGQIVGSITDAGGGGYNASGERGAWGGGRGSFLDSLTCSPGTECYKSKQGNYLKKIYDDKKTVLENAPIELSQAEKNYYIYNDGKNGGQQIYTEFITTRFGENATQFKQNTIEKQQQFMADLSQDLKQYQSDLIFQTQIKKLLKLREKEKADLTNNINYYQTVLQTSERKTVYENKNMDNLYLYRRMMLFVYYAGIICFILFGNFIPDKLYEKYIVWLFIVIASIMPIILNILIKWLFIIYDTIAYMFADLPHKDVYMDLGVPPKGPPPQRPLDDYADVLSSQAEPSLLMKTGTV